MKTRFLSASMMVCAVVYTVISCQKSAASSSGTASVAAAVESLQAIAVGSTAASSSASDSIYVINTCSRHSSKDSIAFSSLPAAVTSYLSSNYTGYTEQKAFSVTDSSGTAAGYIVIIQYNGKPVGLKFDAAGNFVKVLEQRLGSELEGCVRRDDSTHMHHGNPKDSTHHNDDDSTGNN